MNRVYSVGRILVVIVAAAWALACSGGGSSTATPAPAPVAPLPPPVAPVAPPTAPVAPTAPPVAPPTAPPPVAPPTAPVAPPSYPTAPPTSPVAAPTPPANPSDFIGVNMTARQAQFAQGMVPATPLQRGNLMTSQTQDFQAVLTPGRCYKIIGVGGPTVTDLDLVLFDPNGVQIQQDIATDNYPVLGLSQPLCPTVPGAYRVQVKMYAGTGEFGVQVFSSP